MVDLFRMQEAISYINLSCTEDNAIYISWKCRDKPPNYV